MKITVHRSERANQRSMPGNEKELGFGKYFSDHMFLMEYENGKGWFNPRIEPYHPIPLDPCAKVLQYAQQVFEGL